MAHVHVLWALGPILVGALALLCLGFAVTVVSGVERPRLRSGSGVPRAATARKPLEAAARRTLHVARWVGWHLAYLYALVGLCAMTVLFALAFWRAACWLLSHRWFVLLLVAIWVIWFALKVLMLAWLVRIFCSCDPDLEDEEW